MVIINTFEIEGLFKAWKLQHSVLHIILFKLSAETPTGSDLYIGEGVAG